MQDQPERVVHEGPENESDAHGSGRDGTARWPERPVTAHKQRSERHHQNGYERRRQDGSPPRQRNKEQDVPVQQGAWPTGEDSEEDVIENVPDPEGDEPITELCPPGPSSQPANAREHNHG